MANPQGQTPATQQQQAHPIARPDRQGQVGQVVTQSAYIGPTPPPEHIEAYERMLPGAAARFLTLAEGEATHRRSHENAHVEIMKENAKASRILAGRGQLFAFVIAMTGIGAGFWLGLHNAQITGGIIGGGGLVTIILAFLRGSPTPSK